MGRLERHQNKEFTKRVILLAGLLIVIVVLIFTVGFNILLNFSLFIANLGSGGKTQTEVVEDDFVGNIDIDTIPVATNEAHIIVGGSVLNYPNLEFFVNGQKVKSVANASDRFSEEIVALQKGDNEIYILAKSDNKKHEKKSSTFTVTYIADKPKLELKEPGDGTKTNKNEIKVAGTTAKEVYVKINDAPVVVDAQSAFETSVVLKEGENKITIVAQDAAGNTETKTLTVTYQKDE